MNCVIILVLLIMVLCRLCTSVIIGGHGRTTSDDSSDDTISSLPLSDDPEYSNTSKEFKKAQVSNASERCSFVQSSR
jgi:hypothetical protein